MKDIIMIVLGILLVEVLWQAFVPLEIQPDYQQGFEAGKSYIRDSLIANTDSLIGCSRLGYIPDTISVKQELKNGGSYKIKGKGASWQK